MRKALLGKDCCHHPLSASIVGQWTCTHPWWKSSRSPLCSIWSCRSRTTSPPSKLLLYEQVSSVKLHLKAHPYFKKLLHWFLWGGLRWPLPGERLDLITGQSGHWPGHLKYKVIYFRSSCCKGRSSSSSLPGIVRDDINLVNTIPVVCFAGSGETNLPVLGYRDFSPTILKESPVFCPEVKKKNKDSSLRRAVIHHSWQLYLCSTIAH